MKRKWIIIIGFVLFLGLNGLLLAMDQEGKVERTAYIKDWTATFTGDMAESIDKQAVLTPVEKNPVYFDDTLGSFQEFTVDEGDMVKQGDALFSYKVADFENTKRKLEAEADETRDEIDAVEQAISAVSAYDIPETGEEADEENMKSFQELEEEPAEYPPELEEEDDSSPMTMPVPGTSYLQEQYITEKEKELAQKQAHFDRLQAQLSELEMTGDTVTVDSPYEGRVTDLSEGLKKPLMTIESTQLQAEGELTERERMELEQGMPVDITVSEGNKALTGTVQKIKDAPENVSLHGANAYLFYVSLADDADTESLLPGYHTDLSITTNESTDTTIAPDRVLFDHTVWVMTTQGVLKKRPVVTGMEQHGQTELKKEVEPGQWLAAEDADYFRSGQTFITPLKGKQVPFRSFYKQKDWKQMMMIGLLGR